MTHQPDPQSLHSQLGYTPGYPPPRKSIALAITSLTLGIVGLLLSWVPIIGYVSFILGILGVVFGAIGIVKSHRLMSIIGTALSVVAIGVSVVAYASFIKTLNQAVDGYNAAAPSTEVEGEGYPAGGAEGLEQEVEANGEGPIAEVNSRGNIVKAIGDDAGIGGLQRGVDTAVWSIDGIETDVECTEPYQTSKPVNGHLTAVDLNLTTGDDWSTYTNGYGYVSGGYFTFIDSEGVTHSDLETIATYSCLSERETFNTGSLGADQTFKGKVVLDLPDTEGTLVFSPTWDGYMAMVGWEYPVG